MSHKVLLCVKNGIFDFLNGLFMFAAESGEDVFKNACGKKKKKKMGMVHSLNCMHLALFLFIK